MNPMIDEKLEEIDRFVAIKTYPKASCMFSQSWLMRKNISLIPAGSTQSCPS